MDCPLDEVITLVSECELAAVSLGMEFRYWDRTIGTRDDHHSGCFYDSYSGQIDLYFNRMINPSVTKPKAEDVGICLTDGIHVMR